MTWKNGKVTLAYLSHDRGAKAIMHYNGKKKAINVHKDRNFKQL